MPATEALAARLQSEADDKTKFVDSLVEAAEKEGRDLNEKEMDLITRARERVTFLTGQIEPLREMGRISADSRARSEQIAREFAASRGHATDKPYEYRSAGAYILDVWRAGLGHEEAISRLELFKRAAAHQTTPDNPGLLPEQILGPVVSFVDATRPAVTALGARQLPSGSWSRPTVTQHSRVGPQSGEKTELVSQKMTINKVPVDAITYGGYVNVSRQNVDWSQPQVMDIIIGDLAAQYAVETENATV